MMATVTDSPGSTAPPGRPQRLLSVRRWSSTPSGVAITAETPGRMCMQRTVGSGRSEVQSAQRSELAGGVGREREQLVGGRVPDPAELLRALDERDEGRERVLGAPAVARGRIRPA